VQQIKTTGEPIVLTINGKAALVVQDSESYQRLLDLTEEARVLEGIRQGLEDMRAGRGRPADEVFADPVVAENDKFPEEIIDLLHGRRWQRYRIVFTIRGDAVHVLYVRQGTG
jgi:PHD/YefM family antitoxin component YafN of YafNO toxin-antitoxin module